MSMDESASNAEMMRLRMRLAEVEEEAEQLRTQLAGCGVAAMDGNEHAAAKPGSYGWSASYQAVLETRQELDLVRLQFGHLKQIVGGALIAAFDIATRASVIRQRDLMNQALSLVTQISGDLSELPGEVLYDPTESALHNSIADAKAREDKRANTPCPECGHMMSVHHPGIENLCECNECPIKVK